MLLPNVVKVQGGGGATVEEETPTLLNPSSPLSFGLADFGSYLADEAGLPDTQAAGHPSSLTTSFDVNSVVNLAYGSEGERDQVCAGCQGRRGRSSAGLRR